MRNQINILLFLFLENMTEDTRSSREKITFAFMGILWENATQGFTFFCCRIIVWKFFLHIIQKKPISCALMKNFQILFYCFAFLIWYFVANSFPHAAPVAVGITISPIFSTDSVKEVDALAILTNVSTETIL